MQVKSRRCSKEIALEPLVKAVHGPQIMLLATHGFFEPPRQKSAAERQVSLASDASDGDESSLAPPALIIRSCTAACYWRAAIGARAPRGTTGF